MLQIVQVLFEDLTVETASDWPGALRSAPEQPIDLTSPANVFPPRTRAQFLNDLLNELTATLDELRVLGAAGVPADDVNFLDRVINGTFLAAVRAGVLIPKFNTRRVIADEAATLLEQVQTRLPTAMHALPLDRALTRWESWATRFPIVLSARPAVHDPVFVHGDACSPNTLLDTDGQFAANVDLGDAAVADRWADLAVAAMSLEWNYGPGCDLYFFDACGITPDPTRIAYYQALYRAGS